MEKGDIYRIYVAYADKEGGKQRYAVMIGQVRLGVVLMDSITSQYQSKSDFIKKQYYPIQDWHQAGLKKPSYIDILSSRSFDVVELLENGKHTGQLTLRDMDGLAKFIRSYKERIKK